MRPEASPESLPEPIAAGPRLTTTAETFLVGVLVCVASLPVVTALAAAGAGATVLDEFAESGTPVRVRRFVSLLCSALSDPLGWAVPPLLVLVGVLDTLAVAGGLPGRGVLGPTLVLCGGGALVVCATAAASWRPDLRWISVLTDSARTCRGDVVGSTLTLGALAVVALVASAEPAFVVISPGLVLLAAVAVRRRRMGR